MPSTRYGCLTVLLATLCIGRGLTRESVTVTNDIFPDNAADNLVVKLCAAGDDGRLSDAEKVLLDQRLGTPIIGVTFVFAKVSVGS